MEDADTDFVPSLSSFEDFDDCRTGEASRKAGHGSSTSLAVRNVRPHEWREYAIGL